MHRRFLSILLVGVLAASAQAQREPSTAYVGEKIANLTFKDENGKSHSLYDLKDKKVIVLVFFSFDCPVSTSYAQPLSDMVKEFDKHGVAFIGLTTNEDDTPAQVAKQARHYNLNFPVYLDGKLAAARALKAETTPECFVLDGGHILRYRGRIDNTFSERLKKHPQVTRHDLSQVLGELLSGRPVSVPATVAIGCPIPRGDTAIAGSKPAPQVTYHRDVAPILQDHCQQCHRPGEVGPFSLMNYRQAVNWADDIKSYTQKGLMPPWKAVEGPAFHNDRRLARKDIETLAAWVEGGTPEGDTKDAPVPRKFTEGWQLGTPDLVLAADADFTLGPTGSDLLRCFVLPTNLTEDRYVAAVEVRPSNPRVVHHTLQFIDTAARGRALEKAAQNKKVRADDEHPESTYDRGPGFTSAMGARIGFQGDLGGWAPGQMPRFLPEESGFFLPKNSDVIIQVHYHRNGRIENDRTQIGLYFAKKEVTRPWRAAMLPKAELLRLWSFRIPANAEHYPFQGDRWATADFTLYTIMPHMHMVGKEIKVTMTPPGGESSTLVAVKEWDYNWQETYIFKEPIHVKKDTHFHVDAYYDNSSKNLNNPFNPPQDIRFGELTFNEMCFVFLGGTADAPGRNLPVTSDPPKKAAAKAIVAPRVADEPKQEAKPRPVAYKLTDTQHVMVRVKINGKGPFNFIVDTGAPILFVATEVGKKLGLETDARLFAVLDKLEFEGGLELTKVKCRVETPFQLEGMNGMGLPGVELHGILGYTVLANFRMEFDFTKDAMRWTPLDWQPPPPQGIRGDGGQGGLEILGSILKYLGPLMGLKQAGPPDRRGFLGIELADKDGMVMVSKVLAESPAAGGGVQAGDRLQEINGREVKTSADVQRLAARVLAGQPLRITVQRGDNKVALKITVGEGL